jgi:hypothetical protein
MIPTPYGFRVLGSHLGPRRLVDYRQAFEAYCRADPRALPEVPGYLGAFTYGDEFRRHLASSGSTRDYRGPVGVHGIKFDIDREGDPQAALHDTRRLVAFLADQYRLDANDLMVGFSGSKGFHVELPVGWVIDPGPVTNVVCRRFVETIAGRVGVRIDAGIYDKVRLFRAWNSRHQKTGLHKIRIDADDLLYLSIDAIRGRALAPIPFEPPTPSACPPAEADWRAAEQAVRIGGEERRARRGGATGFRINALTLQLIHDPIRVEVGDRHRRIFAAAANLAESATLEGLIAALLTEPGLDTGLPPGEVARQIECGIRHVRGQHGGREGDE